VEVFEKPAEGLGLSDRGGIARTKANCLRICVDGPIAVVYPEGAWYAPAIRPCWERIIQNPVAGRVVREHLITDIRSTRRLIRDCRPNPESRTSILTLLSVILHVP
jgi:(2Fe-2S) ferredoxin